MSSSNNNNNNNNNNKQPLDLTESLPVFDKAQAPSTTRVQSAEASITTPTVNKLDYDGISLVERRSRDVKPQEKNDSLAILLDCAKRGHNCRNQPPSICKVSRILRDLNESSYKPLLVSIGPIHREDPKLQEFEWLKECYLDDLLYRCHDSTPKKTLLEACLLKVNTLIPQIRESYAGVIKNYSDVELATMMVMDGCFILEFCFKHDNENFYLPNKMQTTRIAMDLMLLENQVPFFVLQALFDYLPPYTFEKKGSVTLSQVLDTHLAPYIKLFREKNSTDSDSILDVDSDDPTPAHVLGYLHQRYHLVVAKSSNPIHAEASTFSSIVELDGSGINFKPHQEDEWSMTIKFQSARFATFGGEPTLLMPTLVIDDTTELILRNFIAYEQSFPQDRYYFTSYAHAMDRLIDTQDDIAILVESGVLVNRLGSNQEAADMINKICKNISITDFYYTWEFKQMDTHYNGNGDKELAWMRRGLAWQRREYLKNPLKVFALYYAIILFSLTVVQTIYTIRAA